MKKTVFKIALVLFYAVPIWAMMEDDAEREALCQGIADYYQAFNETPPQDPMKMIADSVDEQDLMQQLSHHGSPRNLDAPWRIAYFKAAALAAAPASNTVAPVPAVPSCPFCVQSSNPATDGKNFFVDRGDKASIFFNLWGTSPLHFLGIPHAHEARLQDLEPDARKELFVRTGGFMKRIGKILELEGFRVLFNLEHRTTGGTLPLHAHGQIYPQFQGEEVPLNRFLISPLHKAERQGGLFKEFKPDGNLARLKPVYDSFFKLAEKSRKYHAVRLPATQNTKISSWHCVTCKIVHKNTIAKAGEFTVLYNPVGAYPGEIFIVNDHDGQPFTELSPENWQLFGDLLAKAEDKVKKITGCHGISVSWHDNDELLGHGMAVRVTPRFDNETSTLTIHEGFKLNSTDRPDQFTKYCQAFAESN